MLSGNVRDYLVSTLETKDDCWKGSLYYHCGEMMIHERDRNRKVHLYLVKVERIGGEYYDSIRSVADI